MFPKIFNLILLGVISMEPVYLSKKEVVRKLKKSPSTVVRWAKSGVIPMPIKLGPNTIVWIEEELNKVLEEKKNKRGFLGHKPKKDK